MNKNAVSVGDYKAVADTVSKYVEALRSGSIDMLTEVFYQDSVTYGVVNGELMGGAGNPTAKFIEINGKSPDIDCQIDVLDMTPFTAVVRVVTEKDAIGTGCCEYLTLVKADKGWAIISKAFIQRDQ